MKISTSVLKAAKPILVESANSVGSHFFNLNLSVFSKINNSDNTSEQLNSYYHLIMHIADLRADKWTE